MAVISQMTEATMVPAGYMYSRNSLEPSRTYYSTGTGYYVRRPGSEQYYAGAEETLQLSDASRNF